MPVTAACSSGSAAYSAHTCASCCHCSRCQLTALPQGLWPLACRQHPAQSSPAQATSTTSSAPHCGTEPPSPGTQKTVTALVAVFGLYRVTDCLSDPGSCCYQPCVSPPQHCAQHRALLGCHKCAAHRTRRYCCRAIRRATPLQGPGRVAPRTTVRGSCP
jgi:hypothetical protein